MGEEIGPGIEIQGTEIGSREPQKEVLLSPEQEKVRQALVILSTPLPYKDPKDNIHNSEEELGFRQGLTKYIDLMEKGEWDIQGCSEEDILYLGLGLAMIRENGIENYGSLNGSSGSGADTANLTMRWSRHISDARSVKLIAGGLLKRLEGIGLSESAVENRVEDRIRYASRVDAEGLDRRYVPEHLERGRLFSRWLDENGYVCGSYLDEGKVVQAYDLVSLRGGDTVVLKTLRFPDEEDDWKALGSEDQVTRDLSDSPYVPRVLLTAKLLSPPYAFQRDTLEEREAAKEGIRCLVVTKAEGIDKNEAFHGEDGRPDYSTTLTIVRQMSKLHQTMHDKGYHHTDKFEYMWDEDKRKITVYDLNVIGRIPEDREKRDDLVKKDIRKVAGLFSTLTQSLQRGATPIETEDMDLEGFQKRISGFEGSNHYDPEAWEKLPDWEKDFFRACFNDGGYKESQEVADDMNAVFSARTHDEIRVYMADNLSEGDELRRSFVQGAYFTLKSEARRVDSDNQ